MFGYIWNDGMFSEMKKSWFTLQIFPMLSDVSVFLETYFILTVYELLIAICKTDARILKKMDQERAWWVKPPAVQFWPPEFNCWNPHEHPDVVAHICNLRSLVLAWDEEIEELSGSSPLGPIGLEDVALEQKQEEPWPPQGGRQESTQEIYLLLSVRCYGMHMNTLAQNK